MIRARAELAAHLMKAARGAGLPLALGEDLYAAAPFLALDDLAWIADDLETGGAGLLARMQTLDDAETGAAIVQTPLLAALAAGRGWGLTEGRKTDLAPAPLGPLEVTDALWGRLERFAALTYVPETAASRARGAGAGDIDND